MEGDGRQREGVTGRVREVRCGRGGRWWEGRKGNERGNRGRLREGSFWTRREGGRRRDVRVGL